MTKTPEELTEEWKAGKLNDGEKYFIRYKNSIFIATFRYFKARMNYWRFIDNGIEYCDDSEEDLIEVLAPYTYDEYKAMQDQIADAGKTIEALEDEIAELKKENKQLVKDTGYGWHTAGIESDKNDELRALLKECLAHLSLGEIGTSVTPINILIGHINAALGESEER
jgi:hypothetical protein|nr:MAG TPA: Alternative WD40 repeat motif [Caudoviricetes sp.]